MEVVIDVKVILAFATSVLAGNALISVVDETVVLSNLKTNGRSV